MIEKTNVRKAGVSHMEILRNVSFDLAPTPGNPRNSEGAFLTLRDGSILFVYSRYNGADCADDAPADLAALRSYDGGRSWSAPALLFTAAEHGVGNIMSVSLLRLGNGDVGLFYILRRGWQDARLVLRRSADEGAHWSAPVCCIPWQGYHVTNNDRVLRLSSGRLLAPAAFHPLQGQADGQASGIQLCGEAHFCCSDDDGHTWRALPQRLSLHCAHSGSGLQEPGAVELSPGVLWGYARTDLGRQYEFFSWDNGESWSAPSPSAFPSPCSPLSVKRGPDGRLYAVWNPEPDHPLRPAAPAGWGRTPLALAVSCDNGKSWEPPLVLEQDPQSGYCYAALHFTDDGALLLAYCAGGPEDGMCLARLRIRRLELR